ncbi:lytic murein transglycosylase [Methylobacterium nigriterrae]|uniref:lytic murein transglycosylase n=1 Tax=Methylobacterium nigriterrae TaxID=3127512 RepID=UPI003013BC02
MNSQRRCLSAAILVASASCADGQAASLEGPRPPASFEICRSDLAVEARARGIGQALVAQQLESLTPDPEVLEAARNQSEFVKPIWIYLGAVVTEARIAEGQRKLAEWAQTLGEIERAFGIDRHILVAIWGVESTYGTVLEDATIVRPVIRSLATLACGDLSRAGYWRDELMAALQIVERADAPAGALAGGLTGSWAGAMGHTQFMPTTYQAQAVDFDGDGRRDIWRSVPDALASTASYLKASGWRRGEGWGYEVTLPDGFDYGLADETTERSVVEWQQRGVRPARPGPLVDEGMRATLVLPAGARGPAFLLFPNFRIILRYNTALAYALTVAHLSDRLRGEPDFVRDWPRGDRLLTPAESRDLQTLLTERGFPAGAVDGKIGPKTRASVRAYQVSVGLVPDGYAEAGLLERIRGDR